MDVKLKINGTEYEMKPKEVDPRHLIFIGKEPEFGRRAADYVAWLKKHRPGDEVETHELPSEDRVGYVRRAVTFGKPIRTLTFFCHGTRNTLAGTINRAGAKAIGAALRENAAPGAAAVGLFSCLTGHDSDGLAGSLHAGTGDKTPVLAHASASPYNNSTGGHTTKNPYKVCFIGGVRMKMWPSSSEWAVWRDELQNDPERPFDILWGKS